METLGNTVEHREDDYATQCRAALMAAARAEPGRRWMPIDLIDKALAPGEWPETLGIYLDELIASGKLIQDINNKVMLPD